MTPYGNLNPQEQMKRPAMINKKIIITNYKYMLAPLASFSFFKRHENIKSNNYNNVLLGL